MNVDRNPQHRWLRALAMTGTLALAIATPPAAWAQDAGTLPTRVGRVANLSGDVYLAPQDHADDWSPIDLNYPVTIGDNVWTAEGARAEIDFGGSQMRMSASANVNIANLDDHNLEVFVAQGEVIVRIGGFESDDSAVIDTPTTQVVLLRPGLYRIGVTPDQQTTTLTLREGEATAQVTAGLQQVLPGMSAVIASGATTTALFSAAYAPDAFDVWSATRDAYYRAARSITSVSPEMVGYDDLANYGAWQPDTEYGNVWYPSNVAPAWAPYSDGYWTTVTGFGLTWVDRAPWGYAPFHYGRWAHIRGRWGWLPGNYVARPVWAPALVAWTGGDVSIGVGVGGPVYGWVALGWREPYRPWWGGCGAGCWDRYNRPYHVDPRDRDRYRDRAPPPDRYANWRVPGAVTAVSGSRLIARKPYLGNERMSLSGNALSAARPAAAPPTLAKPAAGRIPVVRPGTDGAPRPASALYATSKPAQMGLTRPGGARAGGDRVNGQPVTPRSGNRTVLDATGVHQPAQNAAPNRARPADAGSAPMAPPRGNVGVPMLPLPTGTAPARVATPPAAARPAANAEVEAARLRAPPRAGGQGPGNSQRGNETLREQRLQGPAGQARPAPNADRQNGERTQLTPPLRPVAPREAVPRMPQQPSPQPAPHREVVRVPSQPVLRAPQPQMAVRPAPNPAVVAPQVPNAPANPGLARPQGNDDRARGNDARGRDADRGDAKDANRPAR
ncbi:MAG: DUF6600 domain-containing protein [Casimicrobiaceae bacterium]